MSSTDTISEIPFIHVEIPLDSVQPNDTQKELAKEEPSPIASVLRQIKPKWELSACEIELFTNGITNKIFCISQQNGNGQENNNGKLVFRVFGAGSEQIIDRKSELANLARLAQAQLAPPVFATFVNGLVCGFSPGECLTVQSVREPSIVGMIAKKLAQMHKIPLTNSEQTAAPGSAVFIDKTRQWLCTMPSKFESAKSQRQFDDYFADLDLSSQFASMQSALERINYPLVFSHNDLLIYNILLDDAHNEVHFIDFEYAGPNYQLFDLGNHLCEYAGIEDPDYEQDGPTEAERQLLLRRYFFQFRGQEPTADELKKVATEVMHFEAAAHFFWALWAIQQASLSQIPFDYLQYAVTRHRQFTRLRALLDF